MGKNKDNKKKYLKKEIEAIMVGSQDIDKQMKELDKRKKKLIAQCNHQDEKGNLDVTVVDDNNGIVRCNICKTQFGLGTIDVTDLKATLKTLHDMINQIRAFSDPRDDKKINNFLGTLDYNVSEAINIYDKILTAFENKSQKRQKFNKERFGSYGPNGMSFR